MGAVVVGLIVAGLLLLLLVILEARRIRRLTDRLDALTRGSSGRSIESILEAHLEKVFQMGREVDELAARAAIVEGQSRRSLQRVGLVRFDPSADTGRKQSFAVALVDAKGDGIVVTSLQSPSGSRIQAKALSGGQADATLSTEEAHAVEMALAGSPPLDRSGVRQAARPGS